MCTRNLGSQTPLYGSYFCLEIGCKQVEIWFLNMVEYFLGSRSKRFCEKMVPQLCHLILSYFGLETHCELPVSKLLLSTNKDCSILGFLWSWIIMQTHIEQAPIFEWSMIMYGSKNGHQVNMCLNESRLHAFNMLPTLGSIVNITGGTNMIS